MFRMLYLVAFILFYNICFNFDDHVLAKENEMSKNEFDHEFSSYLKNRRIRAIEAKKTTNTAKQPWINPENWGYSSNDGPNRWPAKCRSGRRQSPVNIDLNNCDPHNVTKFHFVNYNTTFGNLTSKNVGHGVMISGFRANGFETAPYIYGGNLTDRYYLEQFHFHWSQKFLNGSEHTINSHHHPVEIHLVHIKAGLTLEEATNADDGIAVLAVFVDLSDDGSALESVAKTFEYVIDEGSETVAECTPATILPMFTSLFFRYEGSLTTPSCAESVIWTVFFESIPITLEQFNALRRVHIAGAAINDARPIQPLNDRHVRLCMGSLSCRDEKCLPISESLIGQSTSSVGCVGKVSSLTMLLSTIFYFILHYKLDER